MINFFPTVWFLLPLLLIGGCNSGRQSRATETVATAYFQTYAERRDFDKFMAFYADDAVLEDIVYGHIAGNKKEISEFFDWNRGDVKLLKPSVSLVVEQQAVDGNEVVTAGYFTPFLFNGDSLGPWRFVIWQNYNNEGKIRRQSDWINYTPRSMLEGSTNLNDHMIGSED